MSAAYVVCITGISGYIATELCKQLLEKGYTVRGTVRSLKNAQKVEHLKKLGDALPGKLELFEADLMVDGSFDHVMDGVDYVFHTASPYSFSVEDPQKDLVDPALKGTNNVLNSVAKHKETIKRVVLTSSVVAISSARHIMAIGSEGVTPKNGKSWSDLDWNEDSTVAEEGYPYSKTAAEKCAWSLAEKFGFELVTIHPSYVFGPVLSSRSDATSIKIISAFIEGKGTLPQGCTCDVRDVARAHVLAAETQSAHGRYIVSEAMSLKPQEVLAAIQARFPSWKFKAVEEADKPKLVYDNAKVQKELGLQLTPTLTSIIDNVVTLVQLGVAKPVVK